MERKVAGGDLASLQTSREYVKMNGPHVSKRMNSMLPALHYALLNEQHDYNLSFQNSYS